MHICIVSGTFPPMLCGVGDSTRVIARGLVGAGHKVTVLTSVFENGHASHDGYEVLRDVPSWMLRDVPRIVQGVRRIRPDAVVLQYPTNVYRRQLGIFAVPAAIRLAVAKPVVIVLHEYANAHWLKQFAIGAMLVTASRTLAFEDDLIDLRRRIPSRFADIRPRPPSPAHFEDQALTESDRSAIRAEMRAGDGDFTMITFGLISPAKGIESLLKAHDLLLRQGLSVRLVVLGPPAPGNENYFVRLQRLAVELGTSEHVTWLGYQPEERVVRMLKSSDVAVLPFVDGVRYPMSASYATAAICAVPIITTQPARLMSEDIFVNGLDVLLVPPNDVGELANAISLLAGDPDLRKKIGENARRTAALTHDPGPTVGAILASLSTN